mmetsp:Transcript_9466/g.27349  ORF Transcript_9466/g.27349 Transcript_9466/m.27349 type:complete len:228 (+) Transcript_9466:646-1329(+)
MTVRHVLPKLEAVCRREVRNDDLPVCGRRSECRIQPGLLLSPQALEPAQAIRQVSRALWTTSCIRFLVMHLATYVVRGVGKGSCGVMHVCVHEVVVHREAWVVELGPPVLGRRHPPPARRPRIGDGLVPSSAKGPAPIVVVPKHAEPLDAVDAGPSVHVLEHPLELHRERPLGDLEAAKTVHAPPIEVVTDVEDVVGACRGRSLLHRTRHALLRLVVDSFDELPRAA